MKLEGIHHVTAARIVPPGLDPLEELVARGLRERRGIFV